MIRTDRRDVRVFRAVAAFSWLSLAALAGCRAPAVTFPAEPAAVTSARADYDTDGDGKADFFLLAVAAAIAADTS